MLGGDNLRSYIAAQLYMLGGDNLRSYIAAQLYHLEGDTVGSLPSYSCYEGTI
jgi:hypothetical protein